MLSPSQSEEVKKQLIEQIESSFPEDKKAEAKKQVAEMSGEELEQFVKRSQSASSSPGGGCIFCSIASGNSQSYKIAEDGSSVAVLEINPVSRGHVIVLPKKHASYKESPETMEFAKHVALLLKEKLSPKDVEIASVDFQGHGAINLIPSYNGESLDSERHRASREELEEVSKILKSYTLAEEPKPQKTRKQKTERKPRIKRLNPKKFWLPKRIP